MDALNFGTAAAPAVKSGRTATPNPFSDHFPTPVKDGKPQALTLTLKGSVDSNGEQITKLTGQARRAAAALETPMTARVQASEQGTGKNVETVVYFWTVEKISRNEKPAAADAS